MCLLLVTQISPRFNFKCTNIGRILSFSWTRQSSCKDCHEYWTVCDIYQAFGGKLTTLHSIQLYNNKLHIGTTLKDTSPKNFNNSNEFECSYSNNEINDNDSKGPSIPKTTIRIFGNLRNKTTHV